MKSLKIGIIVIFILFGMMAALTSREIVRRAGAFSGGPPAGYTGAPLESDCSQCHANNPGPGEFRIVRPANYVPGQTYQIVVQHLTTDTTRKRWGFELTALAGLNAAGTFASRDANTQTVAGLSRFYIEHTSIGTFPNQTGGSQWTFDWTAPPTNVGTITFYAAGNQADNSGTPDGDQIYYALVETLPGQGTPTPTPTPSITPTPTPSAQFTLSGRVLTPDSRALRSAIVSITDALGVRRTAITSSFGLFVFESIPAGNGYVVGVGSKRYRFAPQIISVSANRTDLEFVGLE